MVTRENIFFLWSYFGFILASYILFDSVPYKGDKVKQGKKMFKSYSVQKHSSTVVSLISGHRLYKSLVSINPLSANGKLSRHENLTFLKAWILRWLPRSFATHASLCNTLSSNKLYNVQKQWKSFHLKG